MSKKQKHTQTEFCLPGQVDALTRRSLLQRGISLTGYLTASQFIDIIPAFGQSYTPTRRLVWINMSGGWDLLESVDPKGTSTSRLDSSYGLDAAHELAGASQDAYLGRWLPNLASFGSEIVVVRGLAMGTTSHQAGQIYMDTGVLSNAGRVNAASIPAIVASESNATIPIVQLQQGTDPQTDRGLLNPVSTVRAQNLELYRSMYPSDESKDLRLRIFDYLKNSVDRLRGQVGENDRLTAVEAAEQKIRGQIEGDVGQKLTVSDGDLAPFLDGAPAGINNGLLETFALSHKLLANNLVTCLNMGVGGFDTHSNQERRLQPILEGFDFALSRFVRELRNSGNLDNTLIVCFSDFGRTPRINGNNGRDHWPVGGALMLGGGIEGSRVVGATDENLLALSVDATTGLADANGTQINPTHLGGSVIRLCLGEEYTYRDGYLSALPSLIRLRG